MSRHLTAGRVSNPGEALAYLTDCTLATVQDLAFRARPPKSELARQITIAQLSIDWLRVWKIEPQGRAVDVIAAGGSVADWIAGKREGGA